MDVYGIKNSLRVTIGNSKKTKNLFSPKEDFLMFDQVSIIGCGLIGSSIFKGLKKLDQLKKIITYDNDKVSK